MCLLRSNCNWSTLFVLSWLIISPISSAEIPAVFQGDTPGSELAINYDDLDALLKATVLFTGNSSRQKAGRSVARTGTRLKANYDRLTVNEGNRFHFEVFRDNEELKSILHNIRMSLERIPAEIKLSAFSKSGQLAMADLAPLSCNVCGSWMPLGLKTAVL